MNGHPQQNIAALARAPADAWRGIVVLLRDGHSPIDVSGLSRSRAVLEVADIIKALVDYDPYGYTHPRCDFCHMHQANGHAPSCVWQRAQQFKESR